MKRLLALYRFSLQYPGDGSFAHAVQVYGARVIVMVVTVAGAFTVVTVLAVALQAWL